MKFVFRTDANEKIGIGHVMRCLSLAEALQEKGHDCVFAMQTISDFLTNKIISSGHELNILGTPDTYSASIEPANNESQILAKNQIADANVFLSSIKGAKPEWIIVDHYALNRDWHKCVQPYCNNLMVIDDLVNNEMHCQALLNQNLGAKSSHYSELSPNTRKLMIGPKYALLRKEFSSARSASLKRREHLEINKILLTMGGADQYNYTVDILKKLEGAVISKNLLFQVMVGPSYSHSDGLYEFCRNSALSIEVYWDPVKVAHLMQNADVCIVAAGSTIWECCCLGLPTIALSTAENQNKVLRSLILNACSVGSTINQIPNDLEKLFYDRTLLENLVNNSKVICDGLGARRVVRVLENCA